MEISSLVEKQRAFFQKGITKTPQFRQKALERLEKGIRRYEKEIHQALRKDLGTSEFDRSGTDAFRTDLCEKTPFRLDAAKWGADSSGPVSGKKF